jgi:hypothetical protein
LEQTRVIAKPTKAFFVHTITRDIKLEDCILDLIDNSLDGARNLLDNPVPSLSGGSSFSKFVIEVEFSPERFRITDNCGGISLDDAVNYAFTFGRTDADVPDDYSIGVYGIGMKRAVFKMGQSVIIRSTPKPRKGRKSPDESFAVLIDVEDWLKTEEWDFELESAEPLKDAGVEIVVEDLWDNIKAEFENPTFQTSLRRILARDYARFIQHGLTIKVNGRKVKAFEFSLLHSKKLRPFHADFKLRDVTIKIIAGMAARPSDSIDPDEEGEKEDRSGWYVLCNDRMVVAADKSDLTGWGYGGRNRWHPQYRGFVGIILFSAKAADDLPLTTTKRSIDKDHEIYRLALARMIELTRLWVEYTNRRKVCLDEAKEIEAAATPIDAFEAPLSKDMKFPQLTHSSPKVDEVTIQYTKRIVQVRDLAQKFGYMGLSAREVGSRSFDYAYKELVGGGK